MITVYSSIQEAREHSLDHDLMNRIIGINLYSKGMLNYVSAEDSRYLEGMKNATDELLKGNYDDKSVDNLLESLMENAKGYYVSHRNLGDGNNARDILYDCKRIFLNLYSAPLSANFVVDTGCV